MTEPTTYARMTLKMTTPFAKYGETKHIWSVKFALSGSTLGTADEAEAVALGLWNPIKKLTSGSTNLLGWLYYGTGDTVNLFNKTYEDGTYVGDWAAYEDATDPQQLEVCALLRCPVGVNSKGRTKYLFKHVHDCGGTSTAGVLAAISDPSAVLAEYDSGAGSELLVPVDPTTGVQGGPWQIMSAMYTRQLRRGHRPPA